MKTINPFKHHLLLTGLICRSFQTLWHSSPISGNISFHLHRHKNEFRNWNKIRSIRHRSSTSHTATYCKFTIKQLCVGLVLLKLCTNLYMTIYFVNLFVFTHTHTHEHIYLRCITATKMHVLSQVPHENTLVHLHRRPISSHEVI